MFLREPLHDTVLMEFMRAFAHGCGQKAHTYQGGMHRLGLCRHHTRHQSSFGKYHTHRQDHERSSLCQQKPRTPVADGVPFLNVHLHPRGGRPLGSARATQRTTR